MLVAESATGEYAFLDLTSGAFDLTDRGVKGRETPGPLDGFVYTERGVYRPGEDVHIAALVRDAAGKAASLPVTLDRHAPRRRRAFALHAEGPWPRRPRHHAAARRVVADRHVARQAAHRSRARIRSRRSRSWSRTSSPSASTSSSSRRRLRCRRRRRRPSRQPAAISTARPPPTSPSKATSSSSRRARTSRATPASSSGRPTRPSSRCASRSTPRRPPTRKASPRSPSRCRPSRRRPSRSKPASSCACAKPAAAPSSAASPSRST